MGNWSRIVEIFAGMLNYQVQFELSRMTGSLSGTRSLLLNSFFMHGVKPIVSGNVKSA